MRESRLELWPHCAHSPSENEPPNLEGFWGPK